MNLIYKQNIMMCLLQIICGVYLHAYGQTITVCGKVIDEQRKGIPNSGVQLIGTSKGVYTDDRGNFILKLDKDASTTLRVLSPGYETRIVNIAEELKQTKNDSITIVLRAQNINLKEATVSAKQRRGKKHILGNEKLRRASGCYMQYGDEIAIFLQAKPEKNNGFLSKIFFYITDEGAPQAWFKINVYTNFDDTAREIRPGEKVMDSIFVHASKANSWVSVDVSDRKIPVKGGLFVSMGWVADSNTTEDFHFEDPQPWHICNDSLHNKGIYNGQVLGTTWDYGVLSWTFVKDSQHNFEWTYRPSPFVDEKYSMIDRIRVRVQPGYYPNSEHHWFNPMIYCTYSN